MSAPRLRALVLSGLGAAIACSPEPVGGPSAPVASRPELAITTSCGTGVTVAGLLKNWACGDKIRFATTGATSADLAALDNAAAIWNGAVLSGNNLPQLNVSTGATKTVTIAFSGSGDYYCGNVPDPTHLNVARSASSTACTNPGQVSGGTVLNLLVHELSHVVGFQSNVWHKPSDPQHTGHCAAALYSGGHPPNRQVCQHEIEALYARYGIRTTAPDLFKHVMTGLNGLNTLQLGLQASGTLTVTGLAFERVNGSFCGELTTTSCEGTASPANATLSWSVPTGSGLITLSGSGASRTVTSNTTEGTATVKVNATSTLYEKAASFGDPATGTTASVIIAGTPPAGPPGNMAFSAITATSIKVTWTNADTYSSTAVQYRLKGQAKFITAATLAPGTTAYTLSGLHCAAAYDIQLSHVHDNRSVTNTAQFVSTGACTVSSTIKVPSAFRVTGCTPSSSGGKSFATYALAWTAGANPAASLYQIGEALSNNSGSASINQSGLISVTTGKVGPYLVVTGGSPRYFWIRHVNGGLASAWVALQGNPIQTSDGCLL